MFEQRVPEHLFLTKYKINCDLFSNLSWQTLKNMEFLSSVHRRNMIEKYLWRHPFAALHPPRFSRQVREWSTFLYLLC